VRDGGFALYHNDGAGKFTDATATAGLPPYPFLPGSVAFVDIDHDGDLDLFIGGLVDLTKTPKVEEPIFPGDFDGAPNMLLRNDGNGKFTDITSAAKVNDLGHVVAIIPTDFNNRRDIDLFVASYGKAPALFSNQRDGTFRNGPVKRCPSPVIGLVPPVTSTRMDTPTLPGTRRWSGCLCDE
jgi:hypothetical protein